MARSSWMIGLVSVLFQATLVGAQGSSGLWSGIMQTPGSSPQPLRYIIPSVPTRTFVILPPGATPEKGAVTASNVQFVGVTLRFTANFAPGVTCKLDAIPARGYKGTCTLVTGETRELTLVPPMPGMLLPENEEMLLRDAAPPHLAANVDVFVLGPVGLTQTARGTSGFTCYVRRPTPNDLWPICANGEAASLLAAEQLKAQLRIAGMDERRIADSIAADFRNGRLVAPGVGGIGYMLSRFAWTMNTASGAQQFIPPHLHFYTPHATSASIGVDTTGKGVIPMRVEYGGTPDASVIVVPRMLERP